ncbi:alpha-amylase family glycosyl hydrolase [Flaviaesturariibacter amylovorans]|uniref:Alpha-amylase family glycosyl hydrolase n=1 Tax=Flaviaesturariibacter amylovorans TaxID=1084520 RepID=A0ABP8GCN9_9BACT
MKKATLFLLLLTTITCSLSCVQRSTNDSPGARSAHRPKEYVQLAHPDWSKNATIYEVNIRQYTPEGTFAAFRKHLPRLKELGVDILWLMPIHPIGEKNRKGTLGSYYSVKDYYGVNPEFGTLQDLKDLVAEAHRLGMHVLLDWVANHSAWDNPVATQHPDWYIKTREGAFQSTPWRDYDDIIDFDYSQPALREYMTKAMTYWVREVGIDGYRCDVASFVPIEFWENLRRELDAIRPVFLLAEAADRDLHQHAFDMTYAWSLWDHLHAIATKGAGIGGLTEGYIAEHVSIWPRNAYRMNFVDNHDKNSWEGNQVANFGAALPAAIVLTATMEGMPLLYSGQEAGLDRSLRFFDKDTIQWKEHPVGDLYRTLFQLKHAHPSLWNGQWGGPMERIRHDRMQQVIAFSRDKDGDRVITVVNLSKDAAPVQLESNYLQGTYRDAFTGKTYSLTARTRLDLQPWGYLVLTRQPKQ